MPLSIAIVWGASLVAALVLTIMAAWLVVDVVFVSAQIAVLARMIVKPGAGIEANTRVITGAGGIVALTPGLAAAVTKLQRGLETVADGAEAFARRQT